MSRTAATLRKVVLWTAVWVVAAGVMAPFINAARFRQQIREGLERGLHRKVEITGGIHYTLFRGPGFIADDVLIGEDPKAGIEPFAYVASLVARIRLRSLWTGRLEFSTLILDEPSVNLVKIPGGPWNIQPFLARAVEPGSSGPAESMPDLQVRGGRLNFKFGDTKSVFYFANADVDISALDEAGDAFSIAFEGEPARTDRAAQNFGRLSGRGRWSRSGNQETILTLNVRWERSPVAEFLMLWFGRDAGIHGLIAAETRLEGPLSALRISGRMQLEDIHRWDLMPVKGAGWPLPFRGVLDLRGESLALETVPDASRHLDIRVRLSHLLSTPSYGAVATLREMPVAPLLEIARHMGWVMPPKLEAAGTVNGAVGVSSSGGFQAGFVASDLSLNAPDVEPVACPRLTGTLDSEGVSVSIPRIQFHTKEDVAALDAGYSFSSGALEARVTTPGVGVAEFRTVLGKLVGAPAIPWLSHVGAGRIRGAMNYSITPAERGCWTGNVELRKAALQPPGFAEPLQVESATLHFEGPKLEIYNAKGKLGSADIEGEYRYEPKAARPHRFRVRVSSFPAAELERILLPSLSRRRGLLARTLRLASPPPDWLRSRRAEGVVEIGALAAADWEWKGIHGKVIWDGLHIKIQDLAAAFNGGTISGDLTIDLSKSAPAYVLDGALRGVAWREGMVEAEGQLRTYGLGADVIANLAGKGCFSARDVVLAPEFALKALSGCFTLASSGPNRLETLKLEASTRDDEAMNGRAVWRRGGLLTLELTGGSKPVRLTGTVAPWKLELAP